MENASSGYAHPELLVESTWLAEHLDDTGVTVIDCDSVERYRRAHISSAVGLPVHHYLKAQTEDPRDYGSHVMGPDAFSELIGGLGVNGNGVIVLYDDAGGLNAARVWWVMNYYGLHSVKLLNGGWGKWIAEQKPISVIEPQVSATTYMPVTNPDYLCTLDYALDHVGDERVIFWDVRSQSEWTGENTRGNQRSGHIPGAVHLEWLNFITNDLQKTFKPAQEMRVLLSEAGVFPDREVITY